MYACRPCGLAYEWDGEELCLVEPFTAAVTTQLAVPTEVRYLAAWRFIASVELVSRVAPGGDIEGAAVWERIRRTTSPRPPFLYVPAFSLSRAVMQRLGLRLAEAQPRLDLLPGLPPERQARPALVAVPEAADRPEIPDKRSLREGPGAAEMPEEPGRQSGIPGFHDEGPGFHDVSPVVVGELDARTLAHFVYLALEAQEVRDLRGIDYRLTLGPAELLFLPAVWDPRHVRDSNWRFLLAEFDWLVA